MKRERKISFEILANNDVKNIEQSFQDELQRLLRSGMELRLIVSVVAEFRGFDFVVTKAASCTAHAAVEPQVPSTGRPSCVADCLFTLQVIALDSNMKISVERFVIISTCKRVICGVHYQSR